MSAVTTLHHMGGREFLVQRVGSSWHVSTWCDCLFGPHWHDVGPSFRTKAEAVAWFPKAET